MIDLHTHSTFSDGYLTPTELLNYAKEINLEALALTDHDAVTGLEELHLAAKRNKIKIINGAELSVYYPNTDMEIIALDIPEKSIPEFIAYQKREIKRRETLALTRIELLQNAGYDITYEDIAFDRFGNHRIQIRRPHFADALLKKGYIKTIDEAYEKIFSKHGSCYVKSNPMSVKNVIKFVKDNGAKAILAHPIHTKHEGEKLYTLIDKLKGYGLDGIEVLHSSHSKENRENYLEIIKELNLITTGGSDYHGGTAHPENKLGTGNNNNLNIPYFVLEQLVSNKKPSKTYYSELKKYL